MGKALFMSAGTRIAAGIGAAGAAVGGAVAPLNNYDNIDRNVGENEIPAYHQESPYEQKTPEQAAEQSASEQGFKISNPQENAQPSTPQKIGELGKEVENTAGAAADGQKLKDNAEETGELNNALRENNSSPNADSGQSNDGGYDYNSGYGY